MDKNNTNINDQDLLPLASFYIEALAQNHNKLESKLESIAGEMTKENKDIQQSIVNLNLVVQSLKQTVESFKIDRVESDIKEIQDTLRTHQDVIDEVVDNKDRRKDLRHNINIYIATSILAVLAGFVVTGILTTKSINSIKVRETDIENEQKEILKILKDIQDAP